MAESTLGRLAMLELTRGSMVARPMEAPMRGFLMPAVTRASTSTRVAMRGSTQGFQTQVVMPVSSTPESTQAALPLEMPV